jgi:hypothetical protein
VALVRTYVSEKLIASIIRAKRMRGLGKTLTVTNKHAAKKSCHSDDGDASFLQNVGSYKTHTASHSKDGTLHSHRRENLKSYIALTG